MMKNFKLSSLIFLLLLFCVGLQAQVIPVDWSYINAGNAGNISNATVTIDESTGDFYQIGVHTATAMATTDGTVVSGSGRKGPNTDISISKYDSQGNLIYRTSLGGTGFENDPFVVTRNGLLYILGRTGSSDFPVNDGSSLTLTTSGFSFQSQDLFLTIFDPTGNIVKSSYIGGNGADVSNGLELSDNRLMVSLSTYSTDLPVTNGSSFAGGTSADVAYFALDLNGNILAGTYLGGTLTESLPQMRRVGGKYFATFRTNSGTSFVTTDGSVAPTSTAAALVTLDDNMNVIESKVIGGDFGLNGYDMEVDDDYIYISMGINGGGYPQTTGPSSPVTSAGTDMHVSKFDHDLTLVYGELFTSVGTEYNSSIEVENGNAYVVFTTPSNTLPTTGNPSEANPSTGFGSQASHDYYAMKINSSNTVEYSTYLGGSEDERVSSRFSTAVFGGELYVVFGTTSSNEVSTDGSLPYGTSAVDGAGDIIFYQLDAGGNDKKLEYLGGSHVDYDATLYVRECEILLGYSHRHPATSLPTSFDSGVSRFYGRSNEVLVRYALDPQFTVTNEITPNNQAPCLNGLVDVLNGNAITSDDGRYNASYQWQESIDGEITWADIPGAILKNYAPQTSPDDKHYRRLVYDRVSCTESLVSTSNSAFIEGSSILATELDAGGVLYVCANDPVRIGGNPTATNTTTSDFTYDWDMGLMLNDSTIANPIATVSESTVITLLVTDGNGCVSADQVVINVPIADAGPDRETCEGIGKQIGTPGLPVISGVTYLWSSPSGVADLDCYTCAQTLAEPLVQTTYTLSVTVPSQNGGLPCVLTDNVVVTPVTEPVADFAGPDQIICYTSNANLGLPAESGYEYTWAPGNYLYSNDEAEVVYNSGSDYPDPNPFTYYLTAVYGECSFTDEVVVYELSEADAGVDGCGPRIIGTTDKTPDIAETYSWTVVEPIGHSGAFLGATDEAVIPIGASPAGVTIIYQVEVCFGVGLDQVCCTDQVIVPDCGGGCGVDIAIDSPVGCPSNILAPTTLTASGGIAGMTSNDYTYAWLPEEGLSAYDQQTVSLTDNVQRTYTVTLTSTIDPSMSCFETILVNGPWSLPVATTQSHNTCPGESVNIGGAGIGTYEYEWSGGDISGSPASDPSVSPTSTTTYTVTVLDTGSGCEAVSETTVNVVNVVADAGEDITVCGGTIVQIGSPDPSDGVWDYIWSPVITWEEGNETSAQPMLLAAAGNLTFSVTVTDPVSGCSITDEIVITVDDAAPSLVASPDVTICDGDEVQIGPTVDPTLIYSWADPNGTLSCTDCAQPMASPTSDETYMLTVKYGTDCSAFATDDVMVTVNPLPTLDLGSDLPYCPTGSPVNIGANATASMASYVWSPADFLSSDNVQDPTSSTPSELTYTLVITDTNGCEAEDDITVTPLAGPDAGADKTACINGSTFIGSASNTGTITWTGTESADLSCTDCSNPEFTPSGAGTFTFTISSDIAGCTQTDDVTVTVVGVDMPTIAPITPICQGACTQILFDINPDHSYVWSPTTGLDNPTSANPITCLTATQKYTLTIIDDLTGCIDEMEVTVGVVDVPAPVVSVDDIEVCEGDPAQLNPTVSPVGGVYTYSWSPGAGLNNPNIATPDVFTYPVGTKTYDVQVIDTATGCSSLASADVVIKTCITLSGNVWIDADGNITQDPAEAQTNAGGLYIYLVDPNTGLIIDMAVLGTDGEYMFDVETNSSYQIVLTNISANNGDPVPTADLPGIYYNTGENKDGSTETFALGEISTTTGMTNLENQDFGIQRPPVAVPYWYDLGSGADLHNTTAPLLPSDGMGPISGSDPEDGSKGYGDTFEITDLSGMNGNTLFYDANGDGIMDPSEILSEGDVIPNYDPNKLSVSFTGLNSTSFDFDYIVYDEAGAPSPEVKYEVVWRDALPVEMLYFKAYADDCMGVLKWATASEENNSHFLIEKSTDGRDFSVVGRVDGAGNSTEEIRYSFEDKLGAEKTYYRLKQVDFDGGYDYSDVSVIKLDSKSRCVNPLGGGLLYPNPNSGQFTFSIELDEAATGTKFQVTDMLGQRVVSYDYDLTEGENRINLDLGGYPTGTYFLKVGTLDQSFTYRVIVVDED